MGDFSLYRHLCHVYASESWTMEQFKNGEPLLIVCAVYWSKTCIVSFITFYFYITFLQNNRLLPLSSHRQPYEAIPSGDSSRNQDSPVDDRFGLLWIFLYLYATRVWGTIRFFIFVGHNGSPYLPVVNKVDKVLLYFQSVGDSAQGFVNFMGLILLPFLFRRFQ